MRVFIKTDSKNRITAINSEIFISDFSGWVEIDSGDGDKFTHAQGNYLPKPLIAIDGYYRYKYENGKIVERSEDELKAEYNSKNLDLFKATKISDSKFKLREWLKSNPMQFTDGKFYSVTEEKQTLLNSNLASYERATNAGIPYPLKWNSTGDECVEWEYKDLLSLSLAIAAYVAPKVSIQQSIEVAVKAATTKDEIDAITIDYN